MNKIEFYENISPDYFPIKINGRQPRTYKYAPHWHEQTEIQHVFSGKAVLRCGDSVSNLSEGDTLVIKGGVIHECVSGFGSYGCIIISPEFIEPEKPDCNEIIHDEKINRLLDEIYASVENREDGADYEIRGLTYLLLSRLIKNFSEKNAAKAPEKLEKIKPCTEYISMHFNESITVDTLCSLAHISKGYMTRLFSEATGLTPARYINSVRLKKASQLLEETKINITEVALECGFDDPNYFTRLFKKTYGQSPGTYRKTYIEVQK